MMNDKINRIIGGIDDDLIEAAENIPANNKKLTKWMKVGSLAAAFAVIVGSVIAATQKPEQTTDNKRWQEKYISGYISDEVAGPYSEKTWEVTGNAGRYTALEFLSSEYTTCKVVLKDEYKGEMLGEGKVIGQDMFSLEIHEMDVLVYKISGIDPNCAVAVEFTEPDASVNGMKYVYTYMNTDYEPKTLGDFLQDLDLCQKAETGLAYAYGIAEETIVFEDLNKDKLTELMMSYTSSENVPGASRDSYCMSISVNMLGMEKSISFTDDGYLKTNIFETEKCFYIGKDAVEEFVRYVTENCEGYIYIYEEPDAMKTGIPE